MRDPPPREEFQCCSLNSRPTSVQLDSHIHNIECTYFNNVLPQYDALKALHNVVLWFCHSIPMKWTPARKLLHPRGVLGFTDNSCSKAELFGSAKAIRILTIVYCVLRTPSFHSAAVTLNRNNEYLQYSLGRVGPLCMTANDPFHVITACLKPLSHSALRRLG